MNTFIKDSNSRSVIYLAVTSIIIVITNEVSLILLSDILLYILLPIGRTSR